MARVTAVLFDVDDTLVDHSGAVVRGFLAKLGSVLPDLDAEIQQRAVEEWRRLEELHYTRYLAGELTWQGQRRERVRDVLRWLELPEVSDEQLDAWFEGYRQAFDATTEVFADTLETLDALGVPTGVISNNETANLLAKLSRVGLGERFDVVLCPAEGGLPAKPHPEAFLAGCRQLGSDPATTAYVGDRLRTDAVGARDAGLVGVWLDRRGRERELPAGVVRIGALPELLALVG
ncbi:putative hydrolase of the HAD superfamily [Motilibacter rhizosphaerae]|uniref:Putative hydrolase of the HAD superfamily n=1 Tax=Motilibacter rhizosphaerae TaxID=598652 RepID=A0A4Q7NP28_9ACTN|nr:HAD family hydrolase [Motilibacter rhizosphaerae]RZS87024.1 putative hydrolase of the HAD superfamily [Motilibacter rhizosphaerae]